MSNYQPPFQITNKMLVLVSSISEKLGEISQFHNLESKPHLRRNNRIKSIHSSLRIEANSLSLNEVRDAFSNQKNLAGIGQFPIPAVFFCLSYHAAIRNSE